MANTNKNTVCKRKTVDKTQKQPSESKSPVTVKQLPDGTFEFSGGKGGFNIVERKNNALEPYGKCIWNYGVVLELIPGEKQADINQQIGNARLYVIIIYMSARNTIPNIRKHLQSASIRKITFRN